MNVAEVAEVIVLLNNYTVLCCTEVWPQDTRKQGVAGVDSNVEIPCVLPDIPLLSQEGLDDENVLWIINGSVYGLLQVPPDFTLECSESRCDSLRIPVLQIRMDGYTFQCVHIGYQNNTLYLSEVTALSVSQPPSFLSGMLYS